MDDSRREDGFHPERIPEDEQPAPGWIRDTDPEGLAEGLPPPRPRGGFAGSESLVADSPREVLHRLLDGDPLGIEDRCRTRLRQKAFFLNPERLFQRALARVSFAAVDYSGKPSLGRWLDGCVDLALEDLRSEQYEEEFHKLPPEESDDGAFYAHFAHRTGIEVPLTRLACLALNNLPPPSSSAAIPTPGGAGHALADRPNRLLRTLLLSLSTSEELSVKMIGRSGDQRDEPRLGQRRYVPSGRNSAPIRTFLQAFKIPLELPGGSQVDARLQVVVVFLPIQGGYRDPTSALRRRRLVIRELPLAARLTTWAWNHHPGCRLPVALSAPTVFPNPCLPARYPFAFGIAHTAILLISKRTQDLKEAPAPIRPKEPSSLRQYRSTLTATTTASRYNAQH